MEDDSKYTRNEKDDIIEYDMSQNSNQWIERLKKGNDRPTPVIEDISEVQFSPPRLNLDSDEEDDLKDHLKQSTASDKSEEDEDENEDEEEDEDKIKLNLIKLIQKKRTEKKTTNHFVFFLRERKRGLKTDDIIKEIVINLFSKKLISAEPSKSEIREVYDYLIDYLDALA